jgi:hypothetical protein
LVLIAENEQGLKDFRVRLEMPSQKTEMLGDGFAPTRRDDPTHDARRNETDLITDSVSRNEVRPRPSWHSSPVCFCGSRMNHEFTFKLESAVGNRGLCEVLETAPKISDFNRPSCDAWRVMREHVGMNEVVTLANFELCPQRGSEYMIDRTANLFDGGMIPEIARCFQVLEAQCEKVDLKLEQPRPAHLQTGHTARTIAQEGHRFCLAGLFPNGEPGRSVTPSSGASVFGITHEAFVFGDSLICGKLG